MKLPSHSFAVLNILECPFVNYIMSHPLLHSAISSSPVVAGSNSQLPGADLPPDSSGRPPTPCGVVPWLRKAPSVVCGACDRSNGPHTQALCSGAVPGPLRTRAGRLPAVGRGRRRAPLCGLVSQMARAATVSQITGARYNMGRVLNRRVLFNAWRSTHADVHTRGAVRE